MTPTEATMGGDKGTFVAQTDVVQTVCRLSKANAEQMDQVKNVPCLQFQELSFICYKRTLGYRHTHTLIFTTFIFEHKTDLALCLPKGTARNCYRRLLSAPLPQSGIYVEIWPLPPQWYIYAPPPLKLNLRILLPQCICVFRVRYELKCPHSVFMCSV
jgi:hypothetical protein